MYQASRDWKHAPTALKRSTFPGYAHLRVSSFFKVIRGRPSQKLKCHQPQPPCILRRLWKDVPVATMQRLSDLWWSTLQLHVAKIAALFAYTPQVFSTSFLIFQLESSETTIPSSIVHAPCNTNASGSHSIPRMYACPEFQELSLVQQQALVKLQISCGYLYFWVVMEQIQITAAAGAHQSE